MSDSGKATENRISLAISRSRQALPHGVARARSADSDAVCADPFEQAATTTAVPTHANTSRRRGFLPTAHEATCHEEGSGIAEIAQPASLSAVLASFDDLSLGASPVPRAQRWGGVRVPCATCGSRVPTSGRNGHLRVQLPGDVPQPGRVPPLATTSDAAQQINRIMQGPSTTLSPSVSCPSVARFAARPMTVMTVSDSVASAGDPS